MRRSGRILAGVLARLAEAVRPGVSTAELDALAAEAIAEAGAEPSFRGYRGYPATICASPNDVVVHGIPGPEPLQAGDIISLDVGVFHRGWHTDAAWTFPVGEVTAETARLLAAGEAALRAGLEACRAGARTGDVGHAVQSVAEAAGFSVVREYAGHGIGRRLHEDLWVPNHGRPGRGELLVAGATIAVEPMVNAGGEATRLLEDGWTVVTADGSLSVHFEHTVAITPDGCEVLTAF